MNTSFTQYLQPHSPDHKEGEKCLSESYCDAIRLRLVKQRIADDALVRFSMPHSQCPMPNAQCPIPNAPFPT
ncbi:hypothetical protein [Nostoc sp. CALU 1950]|uniref:hypothetical protein n=1 Tax=Nostoc sp. CALU 1950 TaxID=3104321 RepID=UPI003EC08E70